MTTGFIYALPPAAIYDVFRRYMIGGLTAGAVKPVAVDEVGRHCEERKRRSNPDMACGDLGGQKPAATDAAAPAGAPATAETARPN